MRSRLWTCGGDLGLDGQLETVGSPKSFPATADVGQPAQAADFEISMESRAARVKKAAAEPSEVESGSHSALHGDPRTGACGTRMRRRMGPTSCRLTSGSSREDFAVSLCGGSLFWRGVCRSHEQSGQRLRVQSDGGSSFELVQDRHHLGERRGALPAKTCSPAAMGANEWMSA